MTEIIIDVKRLDNASDLPLPTYATEGAACMDLYAAIPDLVAINNGLRALIPTGLAVALPAGYELQIRSRSGLAMKNGVCVLNSPATIDSDYRGELGVILANFSGQPYFVERGQRIAQMLVMPVPRIKWREVSALPDTQRGAGGFGSTGYGGCGNV
ncbi:dUTP diphosphatase [Paludibacterium sp.]|uniref:dUTP diphosphatase n=1 Tax=Paludibacterium sp. TaxID=1917523 RepID=UPI0025CC6928|nr:dUTP diphosphatase [Paludibacterium sp.]MBV8649621.1 dUTP diphosphatase [Paludibacterium sp.]